MGWEEEVGGRQMLASWTETSSAHQQPPTVTNNHQQPPATVNNYKQSPKTTNNHQEPPTVTNNQQQPPATTNNHQKHLPLPTTIKNTNNHKQL